MSITASKPVTPPLAISSIVYAHWAFKALRSAIDLDLFGAVHEGAKNAASVAARLNFDPEGVALMLEVLVGLGLLKITEQRYALTDLAEVYLIRSSPLYMGNYLCGLQDSSDKTWQALGDCVRAGKPVSQLNERESAENFFPEQTAAIFPLSYTTAQMVARNLNLDELPDGARVLDLAAGSAVWSIPVVEENQGVRVDALDFPRVLEVARQFTRKYGVYKYYRFLAGDWRDLVLDSETYDVVFLGHILHFEGWSASERLLKKVHGAMKPKGRVVIAEFMPNEKRTGPLPASLFALNVYAQTTKGCVFTIEELSELLRSTNFAEINRLELPFYDNESPIVVATRI
jgi:ubiquinone/menaquinone biosynthesis C-methylase UbiE